MVQTWMTVEKVPSSLKRGTVEKVSALVHSPPLEGWQAQPDRVVFCVPTIQFMGTKTKWRKRFCLCKTVL